MNSFSTIARLGKDAELRSLNDGTPVIQFTAAFDSGFGDRKVTTWMQCALFGKRATDNLATHLLKGQQIGLVGEIKLDEWQGRDGSTQKTLKMRVNDLTLIAGQQQRQAAPQQQAPTQQAAPAQDFNHFDDGLDSDIPF